ncbi:substrate-binding periplasmic protein [Inhella gelatinilytica]|uniref:Transporter substrate-binding domain-containing protein n=1 Tax=Inhella gelatinilytica TaxID=2795030 RepID=A0A931ND95_9BURK|nr:transporter substrate-binding domain-containing protein [Inhella gelatinilytica]MBH9552005.1 transporter substrate-binding domain-containing protein [Inhella gelatinilytica]
MIDRRQLVAAALAAVGPRVWAKGEPPVTVLGVELPPLIMATPYGAAGVVVETVQQAFQRLNRPVVIKVVPWARAYAEVTEGRADGLIPTIRSAERETLLDFPTQPVFRSDMVFFARADAHIPWRGHLADVAALKFVKLRGALFAPEFDRAVQEGRLQCEETTSFASAIRMVQAKRADLAAVPHLGGLQVIASEGLGREVVALQPPVHTQDFFLALAKGRARQGLRERLDREFEAMKRDGSTQAIVDDYRRRNWLPPTRN